VDTGLALHIASKLLMVDYETVDDDVLDAVAEVSNMIVDNIKTALEDTLGPMGRSVPAVAFGGDFETRAIETAMWCSCHSHAPKA
jgi:CheY-specific phosphatase CheX